MLINSAPDSNSGASSKALAYAESALAQKHHLRMVFFYADGVAHLAYPEHKSSQAWQAFAQLHGLSLEVCSTVVERDFQLAESDVRAPFLLSGLTEFVSAAAAADELVEF